MNEYKLIAKVTRITRVMQACIEYRTLDSFGRKRVDKKAAIELCHRLLAITMKMHQQVNIQLWSAAMDVCIVYVYHFVLYSLNL
jgi:hypothetical protein